MIYWSRQIIGLVLGFIWGQVPFHGFVGIFLFGGLSAGIIYVWFTAVQGIDEVEYDRAWELTEEGLDFSPELWGPLSQRLLSSHGHVVKRRRGATR